MSSDSAWLVGPQRNHGSCIAFSHLRCVSGWHAKAGLIDRLRKKAPRVEGFELQVSSIDDPNVAQCINNKMVKLSAGMVLKCAPPFDLRIWHRLRLQRADCGPRTFDICMNHRRKGNNNLATQRVGFSTRLLGFCWRHFFLNSWEMTTIDLDAVDNFQTSKNSFWGWSGTYRICPSTGW